MNKPFYIVLSSKTSDFHCTLPNPISLTVQYEVGLVEFSYTMSWPTIDEIKFTILPQTPAGAAPVNPVEITVPKGFYRDTESMLKSWHDAIPTGFKQYLTVKSGTSSGQYEINIGPGDGKANGGIRFSDYAKQILGLTNNEIRTGIKGFCDMNINRHFLITEADFVESQLFNNSAKPFLHISHINFAQFNFGSLLYKQIVTPMYVTVNRQLLSHLNIETKFESNSKPEFYWGWNHLVLHFRPKSRM